MRLMNKERSLQDRLPIMFTVLAVFLTIFELFTAGYFTARGQWADAIPAAVLGLFWLGVMGLMHNYRISQVRMNSLNHEKEILDGCIEMLEKSIDPEIKQNIKKLAEAMENVSPNELPKTEEQLQAITIAYNEKTGHGVALSFHHDKDGNIIGVNSEFDKSEDTLKPAAIHVPISTPNTLKLPTKSQQRRINDKKGRGPITDEEYKAQVNAKRRASRTAKLPKDKAAPSTQDEGHKELAVTQDVE